MVNRFKLIINVSLISLWNTEIDEEIVNPYIYSINGDEKYSLWTYGHWRSCIQQFH